MLCVSLHERVEEKTWVSVRGWFWLLICRVEGTIVSTTLIAYSERLAREVSERGTTVYHVQSNTPVRDCST